MIAFVNQILAKKNKRSDTKNSDAEIGSSSEFLIMFPIKTRRVSKRKKPEKMAEIIP